MAKKKKTSGKKPNDTKPPVSKASLDNDFEEALRSLKLNATPQFERNSALLAIIDSNDGPPGLGAANLQPPPIADKDIPIPKDFEQAYKGRPEYIGLRQMWYLVHRAARNSGFAEGVRAGKNTIRNNPRFWNTYDQQVKNAVNKEKQRWMKEGNKEPIASKQKQKAKVSFVVPEDDSDPDSDSDGEDSFESNYREQLQDEFDIDLDELGHEVKDNPILLDPLFLDGLRDHMSNVKFFAEEDEKARWVKKGHGDQCFAQGKKNNGKQQAPVPASGPSKVQRKEAQIQTDVQPTECPDVEDIGIQTDIPEIPPPPPLVKPRQTYPDLLSVPPTLEPLKDFNWADDVDDELPWTPLSQPQTF